MLKSIVNSVTRLIMIIHISVSEHNRIVSHVDFLNFVYIEKLEKFVV